MYFCIIKEDALMEVDFFARQDGPQSLAIPARIVPIKKILSLSRVCINLTYEALLYIVF